MDHRPKKCTKCGKRKSTTSFGKAKKNKDGLRYTCRVCDKFYRDTNLIRMRYYAQKNLKFRFTISADEYTALFEAQNSRCAICGKHQVELKKALSIDHNHENGIVRGLLCPKCNSILGFANDSRGILLKAVKYLGK